MRPDAGNRKNRLSGEWIAEQRLELQDVLRERVGGRILSQGAQRDLVGTGRAPEPQIERGPRAKVNSSRASLRSPIPTSPMASSKSKFSATSKWVRA